MLQLSNDPLLYNSISIYELTGAVQASRLRQAVASVVAHHESLHLSFYEKPATGLPVQGLLKTPLESFKHIVGAKSGRVETEIERLKHHEWLLHQGNGLQVVLVSHNAREHHLLIAYHHIVMDGVGHYFFLRDLNTAYRGLPLRKIELGYMDLSVREQQRFQQGHLDADLRFWEKLVRPDRPAIELLPFSSTKTRPLLSVHQNHESRKMLGAPLVRMINDASRRLRISPFHFYTAAIQTLLYRLLDLRDVCIGVTDANRDTESAEMPGLFLNLLPLVFDIDGASTFGQLASRTHRIHREAQKHGFVPLDIILNKANIPRDRTHTPLFQVVINYRQGNSAQLPLGNARLQCISVEEAKSPYDIAFTITPADEVSYVQVITRSDLYSQDATNLCSDLLVTLLGEAASDWSRLLDAYQLYDTKQVQKATELGKASTVDFGWPGTLTALVDNMISTYPKEPAVYDQEGTISYATLGQKVNDLASSIRATHWPQKHPRVAVICQPSKDWIISMLAILRLGGVYVPLDTTLPDDRLSKILDSANPDLILCHQPTQQRALDLADKNTVLDFEDAPTKSRDLIPDEEQPGKLSFILFTSGSTGTPKGVMLTQTGIINYLASKVDRCALKTETVLQQSALGFDMSLAQAFHALARGGKLIIAPASSRGDPFALSRLMVDQSVSMTVATPTEYLMLLRYGVNGLKSCSSWCNAFSGGEAVTAELKRAFTLMKQPPTLTDCYGPTEISCCATMHTVSLDVHEDAVIGRPNPNSSIYILDEHGSCLPVGMPGEIAVGGNGLAMGYLDPNATETKFALITAPNATDSTCLRVYKTGDKGVFRSDGNLKYLGRIDGETTVKVHGARLDLQDVSNTMLHASEGQLLDAIVTVRGNPAFLVAHVVLNDHSSLDLPAFANSLPLPRYMKPAVVVPVTSLPVNANGKVDRIAVATFPLPGESNAVDSSLEKRPLSITEGELKLLWMNVLGQTKTERTPLRSTSDFFLCGGTSMNLVKLQALIRTSIGLELSIPDLYENSTIESMAALITEQGRDKRQICIDWTSDTALPADLDFSISSSPVRVGSTRGIEILMTGTDGFFGSAIASRLLKDPAVSHIHCLAVESEQITSHWNHKKATVYAGSLSEDRLGLDSSTFKRLQKSVSRVILAGSQGHCLNNYTSLRTPNVLSVEQLAIFALPRRIPIHFISSGRTTLLNPAAEAALPQVSVAEHAPPKDGSEGFTASKWAAEVILEKFAVAASDSGNPLPVMIHRPGALIGDDAPIEDALNALIRFSRMLHAVPRTDNLDLAGYLDFKYVSEAADEVCRTITSPLFDEKSDPRLVRFVHHSGRVKVPPTQFKQHMEKTFKIPFEELELDEWLQMAQNEGLEDLIVAYLREVTALGETLVFPYLGQD